LKVAGVQLDIPEEETKEERIARAAALVEGLGAVDLVVLPEIWNVGYLRFDGYETGAEPLDGPTVTRLAAAARRLGAWVLAGSIVERSDEGLHNTSVLLDRRGEIAGTYRKIHLFGYGSREPELLERGEKISVLDTEFGRWGLSTCYDLRFPELFRAMVDDGAEGFLVPSAWPYPRVEAWATLIRARAIENQAWLIAVNCCGGGTIQYCGRSAVVDPWGTAAVRAGDRATVLSADIDPAMTAAVRRDFPALADRVLGRRETAAR
jgi:predicted amidohydrolase